MKLLFLGLGAGQIFCYCNLLFLGNLKNEVSACIGLFCTAFVLYSLSLFILYRDDCPEKNSVNPPGAGLRKNSKLPFCLTVIIIISVCARFLIYLSPPTLSDDIYRYVWEGKIFSAGFNPFEFAPDNPKLEQFRDAEIFTGVTRKNITTIYPPVSQFIFAACARVNPTLSAMKMTFILFDLATIAVLILTLYRLKQNILQVAIYALNPLVIIEFAGSGHLDSAGILFLMLSLYLFIQKDNISTYITLAASFLVKFLPIFILPFIIRKKYFTGIVIFAVIICAAYIPFLSAGEQLFYALGVYSKQWYFNAPIYDMLLWICNDNLLARKISLFVFVILMMGMYLWHFRQKLVPDALYMYRISFFAIGIFLFLSPTLHPWYVCWIIPFLAIVPNRAWILFSGTVFLSYWVLKDYAASGVWKESPLVKAIEYMPFYFLLTYDWRKNISKYLNRNSQAL